MHRHLVPAALAAGLLALMLPVVAHAATSPIQPSNRPTPIAGATNGNLPAADLVNVAAGCAAARAAAPSIALLLATAREAGVALGTEQCYRSLADQQTEAQIWTGAGNSACAAPIVSTPTGAGGTSMHGWGKAADFSDAGGTVAFGSPGYAFLKANAGRFGWNHPGWAEPGGSACPEAWHWEWVGDGGVQGATPIRADVVALLPSADDNGYASVSGLGALTARGDATDDGSPATGPIPWVITGAAGTGDGAGYWLVGADGSVYAYGDATLHGSLATTHVNQPIVGMAATADGGGYWLVASDGGIFSFGDAHFWGSAGALPLQRPIVGMASTPDGGGYWLVASDGGIFTFGDAHFAGSEGGTTLPEPAVAVSATRSGRGYWVTAANGAVAAFGDARPFGGA